MTALIARWLSAWFPVEELTADRLRRFWAERNLELLAKAYISHSVQKHEEDLARGDTLEIRHRFQSAAPTVGR